MIWRLIWIACWGCILCTRLRTSGGSSMRGDAGSTWHGPTAKNCLVCVLCVVMRWIYLNVNVKWVPQDLVCTAPWSAWICVPLKTPVSVVVPGCSFAWSSWWIDIQPVEFRSPGSDQFSHNDLLLREPMERWDGPRHFTPESVRKLWRASLARQSAIERYNPQCREDRPQCGEYRPQCRSHCGLEIEEYFERRQLWGGQTRNNAISSPLACTELQIPASVWIYLPLAGFA